MERQNYRPSPSVRRQVFARDGQRCTECGCGIGEVCSKHYAVVRSLDAAHIVPWPLGEPILANLRVLCRPCNLREQRGPVQPLAWLGAEAVTRACIDRQ